MHCRPRSGSGANVVAGSVLPRDRTAATHDRRTGGISWHRTRTRRRPTRTVRRIATCPAMTWSHTRALGRVDRVRRSSASPTSGTPSGRTARPFDGHASSTSGTRRLPPFPGPGRAGTGRGGAPGERDHHRAPACGPDCARGVRPPRPALLLAQRRRPGDRLPGHRARAGRSRVQVRGPPVGQGLREHHQGLRAGDHGEPPGRRARPGGGHDPGGRAPGPAGLTEGSPMARTWLSIRVELVDGRGSSCGHGWAGSSPPPGAIHSPPSPHPSTAHSLAGTVRTSTSPASSTAAGSPRRTVTTTSSAPRSTTGGRSSRACARAPAHG